MRTITGCAMTIGLLSIIGCAGEAPKNLGVSNGMLAACPSSPNCVSSQSPDQPHRIAPLSIKDDPDTAWKRLTSLLKERSDVTIVSESSDYLRVELRTMLFVDDGEFLLDRGKKKIHIRSASRLGYSDLGKNRRRIEEIRSSFIAIERY